MNYSAKKVISSLQKEESAYIKIANVCCHCIEARLHRKLQDPARLKEDLRRIRMFLASIRLGPRSVKKRMADYNNFYIRLFAPIFGIPTDGQLTMKELLNKVNTRLDLLRVQIQLLVNDSSNSKDERWDEIFDFLGALSAGIQSFEVRPRQPY